MAASRAPSVYARRRPERTALYEVVRDNLETLYGAITDGALEVRLGKHARKELEGYLECGVLGRGFARLRCGECKEKLVTGKDMGPVTTEGAEKRIEGYIAGAEKAGAKFVLDGRGKKGDAGGFWVGPTIIDHATAEMQATKEEIFGPVLTIVRVPNLEKALEIENANPYGNASSVYTTSGNVARRVMERVEAGMCGVNVGVPVPREPFGFGAGNLTGWDGYRFWTRQRKITSKWALQKDQTWMG